MNTKPRPPRLVTRDSYNEAAYLESNPDVAEAVAAGVLRSGREHFERYGAAEGRRARPARGLAALRADKALRIAKLLHAPASAISAAGRPDFRLPGERDLARALWSDVTRPGGYDPPAQALIRRHKDDLVLDCGAGARFVYYPNVVNFDIAEHTTTDILGNAARLPFRDASFEAVICTGLLEHVPDPFRCAREIARVLKPGGELLCGTPFLQPQDGPAPHYFHMTPQGLEALFTPELTVTAQEVTESALPVWALSWMIHSWATGLDSETREEFLALRLADLMGAPETYLDRPWVRGLSGEKNRELACGFLFSAQKPMPATRGVAAGKPRMANKPIAAKKPGAAKAAAPDKTVSAKSRPKRGR